MSEDHPPDGPAQPAEDSAIDQSARPAVQRRRTFHSILANTAIASLTTSYLWFAITFWIYDETRNVIATGVIGGVYMLLLSVTSVSFGTLVDRFRKLLLMRFAAFFTLACFALAGVLFFVVGEEAMTDLGLPWFWLFSAISLIGAVVENLRSIALATTVTILIDPEERANANGLVGMVQGLSFMVTSVFSGLSVGWLGMGPTTVIAIVLVGLTLLHLLTLTMPEEVEPAASDAEGGFDLRGAWGAVIAISGLFSLILFSTYNNFIGGTFMALMDPYGIELFTVQWWGVWFAIASTGFLVGGALIARFGLGKNPMRTLLVGVIVMGLIGGLFTIREWGWLYLAGIWLYMAVTPAVEAAEQTLIQRVVPLQKQGRVFGFAMMFEASAAPVTAFVVAPIAEGWIIPWARGDEGRSMLRPLLGDGDHRGIALIFVVTSLLLILSAVIAFLSPVYRRLSETYARVAARDAKKDRTGPGDGASGTGDDGPVD